MLIRLVVRAPFLVIGSTIMAFMIDVKLAGCHFRSCYSACCDCYVACHNKDYPLLQVDTEKAGQAPHSSPVKILSVQEPVRAFSKQQHEIERFRDNAEDIEKAGSKPRQDFSTAQPCQRYYTEPCDRCNNMVRRIFGKCR